MKDKLVEWALGDGGILRVRGLVTLALTATICVLWINGNDVPADLQKGWFAATAFYFGFRTAAQQR